MLGKVAVSHLGNTYGIPERPTNPGQCKVCADLFTPGLNTLLQTVVRGARLDLCACVLVCVCVCVCIFTHYAQGYGASIFIPYPPIFSHCLPQVKSRLVDTWGRGADFSELQSALAPHIACYRDMCFPQRTHANAQEITDLYCLHALNHVLKYVRVRGVWLPCSLPRVYVCARAGVHSEMVYVCDALNHVPKSLLPRSLVRVCVFIYGFVRVSTSG